MQPIDPTIQAAPATGQFPDPGEDEGALAGAEVELGVGCTGMTAEDELSPGCTGTIAEELEIGRRGAPDCEDVLDPG